MSDIDKDVKAMRSVSKFAMGWAVSFGVLAGLVLAVMLWDTGSAPEPAADDEPDAGMSIPVLAPEPEHSASPWLERPEEEPPPPAQPSDQPPSTVNTAPLK